MQLHDYRNVLKIFNAPVCFETGPYVNPSGTQLVTSRRTKYIIQVMIRPLNRGVEVHRKDTENKNIISIGSRHVRRH